MIDVLWSLQAISDRQMQELNSILYPTPISRAEHLLQLINTGPGYVRALTSALQQTQQAYIAKTLELL